MILSVYEQSDIFDIAVSLWPAIAGQQEEDHAS